eukprot:g2595.t1
MGLSDSEEDHVGEDGNEEVDDDGNAHDEGEESVEDTDDEDEDVAYYEQDGFVVDEEELDEDEEQEEEEENHHRPKSGGKKKRRRRDSHMDVEDYSWMVEDNEERRKTGNRLVRGDKDSTARLDQPRHRLGQSFEELEDFHDDDASAPEDGAPYTENALRFESHPHHEMDDFIEYEKVDSRARPVGTNSVRHLSAAYPEAAAEVAEIFGDSEELIAMFQQAQHDQKSLHENPVLEGIDSITDGMDIDELQSAEVKRHLAEMDPEALAIHGLRPEDSKIRKTDIPERFQKMMGPSPESMEYDLAAKWIYAKLFGPGVETVESEIVQNGRLEIDGPSETDDYTNKDPEHFCKGRRVIRKVRTIEQKEQWKQDNAAQEALQVSIEGVLKCLYQEQEEVPYIATYRKKLCGELLCMSVEEVPSCVSQEDYDKPRESKGCPPPGTVQVKHTTMKRWQVLWKVYEMSLKWRSIRLWIEGRIKAFREMQNQHLHRREVSSAIQNIINKIKIATSYEEINTLDKMYKLTMAVLGIKIPTTGLLLDDSIDRFVSYNRMGYRRLVLGMGIRSKLLLDVQSISNPSCCSMSLQEQVDEIMELNKGSVGSDLVLYGAQHVAAMELSSNPIVKKIIQEHYLKQAMISTVPTDTGEKVLDAFHPHGAVKRLESKPVRDFKGDLFLRIIAATKQNYLTYKIEVPEKVFQSQILPALMQSIMDTDLILLDGWQEFQKDCLSHLTQKLLFPQFEKELIEDLTEKSRTAVLEKMSKDLWKHALQAPFKPPVNESDYEEEETPVRVCACCWGPGGKGHPSTVLVMLDSLGELKAMIELKQFSGFLSTQEDQDSYEPIDVLQDDHRKEDAQLIREFLMEHKPHVVVVGGSSLACRQLVKDLELIREHFLTEHSRFMVSIQGGMEVFLMPESLASIWESSPAAEAELPDHSPHVRRAVAIGRSLIDPLSVLASLRDYSDIILSLHLSDLQELILNEIRLTKIDQILVTAINQIGCELNLVANVQWRSHSLQFVCGLGRLKAQGLMHIMHRNSNRIESRADLMTYALLGSKTMKNAIGFLCINGSDLPGMANIDFEPLDETRIHFEHYHVAKDLAMIATQNEDPEAALVELFASPDQVQYLNVDWFNDRGIEKGREDMLSLIIDMQMEFLSPFQDRRPKFSKPQELEVFYMLMNETEDSMKPGKFMEATVDWVEDTEIHCSLIPTRLKGVVKKEQFSSTEDPESLNLRYRVRRGDVLTTRLIAIDFEEFQVELTCRQADLENEERWEKEYCTDEHYKIKSKEEKEQDRLAKEARQEKTFIPRRIDHPLFKNISQTECISQLAKSPLGHAILRPSNEGPHCITLSFNTFTGKHGDIYLHRNISEGQKGSSATEVLKLGLPLTIMLTSTRSMQFDDLDEVVPCFVDPYIDRMRGLMSFRKFRDGYQEEIDALLIEERKRMGGRGAAYCLSIDYLRPGCFYIASIWNKTVHREYFSIVPDGYYYRKQIFKDLELVTEDFKRSPAPPVYAPREQSEKSFNGGASATGNVSGSFRTAPQQWSTSMATGNVNASANNADSSDEDLHF